MEKNEMVNISTLSGPKYQLMNSFASKKLPIISSLRL
jgi:hypothetical protein